MWLISTVVKEKDRDRDKVIISMKCKNLTISAAVLAKRLKLHLVATVIVPVATFVELEKQSRVAFLSNV